MGRAVHRQTTAAQAAQWSGAEPHHRLERPTGHPIPSRTVTPCQFHAASHSGIHVRTSRDPNGRMKMRMGMRMQTRMKIA